MRDLANAPYCLGEEITTKGGQIRGKLKCLLPTSPTSFYIYKVCLFVCLFLEREECTLVGKGQRERERENPSRLRAVSAEPDAGLNLRNRELMT